MLPPWKLLNYSMLPKKTSMVETGCRGGMRKGGRRRSIAFFSTSFPFIMEKLISNCRRPSSVALVGHCFVQSCFLSIFGYILYESVKMSSVVGGAYSVLAYVIQNIWRYIQTCMICSDYFPEILSGFPFLNSRKQGNQRYFSGRNSLGHECGEARSKDALSSSGEVQSGQGKVEIITYVLKRELQL